MLDLDDFYAEVGEFGQYQIICVLLLTVGSCFLNAYNQFTNVFLLYSPRHRCKLYQDESPLSFDSNSNQQLLARFDDNEIYALRALECSLLVTPHAPDFYDSSASAVMDFAGLKAQELNGSGCPFGWLYSNEYFDETVISKWDLVCDDKADAKFLLSFIGFAAVLGCLPLAWVQDRFGRRICFIVCNTLYILTSLGTLLSPDFKTYTVLRTVNAISMHPAFNCCYTWALEFVGLTKRTLTSTVHCIVFAFACITVGVVAYFCRTWQQVTVASTLPFLGAYAVCFVVMESPRWLISQRRNQEAEAVLRRIAQSNGVELRPELLDEVLLVCAPEKTATEGDGDSSPGYIESLCSSDLVQLFRGPNLRLKTLILSFCWIANCLVYAAIPFNSENLSDHFYVAYIAQAAMEAPATIANLILLNRIGRIWPLFFAMLLSGISGLLCSPAEGLDSPQLLILLAVVSKFGISMSFDAIYQVAGEIFPTVVRGQGLGFADTVGEFGNVLMPFLLLASTAGNRQLPMVIMGLMTILSALVLLLLPETKDLHLPESLEDAEKYGKAGWPALKDNTRRLANCLCCAVGIGKHVNYSSSPLLKAVKNC